LLTEAETHIESAIKYVKIAESEDASIAAYEQAADSIMAAQKADPTLSLSEISRRMGRGHDYAGSLVRWRTSESRTHKASSPFARTEDYSNKRSTATVNRVANEDPDKYVKAYEEASPEAKRKIAEKISKDPAIKHETIKRLTSIKPNTNVRTVKTGLALTLMEFQSKLYSAEGALRKALEIIGSVDQPGDDENIIQRIADIKRLAGFIDEVYQEGKARDTWGWELFEEGTK
jgi:hypothetical protein